MPRPVLVTSNPAKAAALAKRLGTAVDHVDADLAEIQSLSLPEVVEAKARAAHDLCGGVVIVEDAGLSIDALGRLPGPLVRWFLAENGNDGLCRLADPDHARGATAAVCFGLYDGTSLSLAEHRCRGTIARVPQGEQGFGWDPVFIPTGHGQTWAEMTPAEQERTSMRGPALARLARLLPPVDVATT